MLSSREMLPPWQPYQPPFEGASPGAVVGIDVDSSRVRMLVPASCLARHARRKAPAGLVCSVSLAPGVVDKGRPNAPDVLRQLLRDLLGKVPWGMVRRRAAMALTPELTVQREWQPPPSGEPLTRESMLRAELARRIGCPPGELCLDYRANVIPEPALDPVVKRLPSTEGSLRIVAAQRRIVDDMVQIMRGAGCRPVALDVTCWALEAFANRYRTSGCHGAVAIGESGTSMALVCDGGGRSNGWLSRSAEAALNSQPGRAIAQWFEEAEGRLGQRAERIDILDGGPAAEWGGPLAHALTDTLERPCAMVPNGGAFWLAWELSQHGGPA